MLKPVSRCTRAATSRLPIVSKIHGSAPGPLNVFSNPFENFQEADMGKGKILIADDDSHVLELLSQILSEEGYSVETAPDGITALDLVTKCAYDLLISDVRMPGIDGFELLERVKKHKKDIKVIMMTGYTDDYDISEALLLGADEYITKPFD